MPNLQPARNLAARCACAWGEVLGLGGRVGWGKVVAVAEWGGGDWREEESKIKKIKK